MIRLPELDAFTAKYAQCDYEPLRVTIKLQPNSRVVNYDPIHFDGLLARAVVTHATKGRLLADSEDGYWIPLPLKMLWKNDDSFPLWAASVLYPITQNVDDITVRHKRNSDGHLHNKKKLVTRAGPWMERRIPTPVQVCDVYEAVCIGNRVLVQELLEMFTHIGKLRQARVDSVTIEPVESVNVLWRDDKLIKPVPAQADLIQWLENPSLIGWTPPFWKPSLFAMGWRVGMSTPMVFDFFNNVP